MNSALRTPSWLVQGTRFVGSGVANSALTFLLYQVLVTWMSYAAAYTLSFAAGIAFAAVVTTRLVFASRLTWTTAFRFAATYCALYAAGLGITIGLVDLLGVPQRIAPIGTAVLLLPVSFLASRAALTTRPPK